METSAHTPNDVPPMVSVDICGLSCRFPESSSPSEFYDNLVSGRDMITESDDKWNRKLWPEVPTRFGKLKKGELNSFDQQFFTVHGQQAKRMEPQLMKLLELSWEAWTDSGIDVRQLRDSNRVGVYTGICGSEVHGAFLSRPNEITGYEQTGCSMCMTANRVSFFYSFHGPSKTCDTACSSAAISLHDALADITAGRTDYAIVLGSCYITSPAMSMAFNRLHMLSPEGMCKAFDAAGNGYVRAEGMAAVVLKRSGLQDVPYWAAVSPYATFLNAGTNNDGHTKEGIAFPNKNAQEALEQQVCNMGGINPADVVYVEAHGTGTVAGDGQELAAIDDWYGRAPGREAPLMIGSVKSNMGHCEGCSCLAGLIKICLSLEHGYLPGNLHYYNPNPTSAGLRDGTLKVVDETTEFKGGLVALSSFGFGGSNVHFVLQGAGGSRQQLLLPAGDSSDSGSDLGQAACQDGIPLAARTAEGLANLAKAITEAEASAGVAFAAEPLRRYANNVISDFKFGYRGILSESGELKAGSLVTTAPKVWFAFSGNGSQWPQMGFSLLQSNATFAKAVAECAAALEPYNVDLLAEFASEAGFKGPMLATTGLLAVQIGLVDMLREDYGIVPDGMLGHSAGETACTYASGCCNKQQAMLIAYHRGRLPMAHGIKGGLMAATGLSAEQARERLQGSKVVLACDNSPKSTTVSGPAEAVRELVAELEAEGVFARALDTSGVPYHSYILDPILRDLEKALSQVMPNPVKRPASWVSAAFPEGSDHQDADLCSAGYQVFSMRNPVLFTEAAKRIPDGAIVVEIGPHSILRSPLRQTCPALGYIGAMRKGECGVATAAAAVGELWRKGAQMTWRVERVPPLAAGTELPRSVREALISWDRTIFEIPELAGRKGIYERMFKLGGADEYICDHNVDGVVFLPFSSFLVSAWEGLANHNNTNIWDFTVEFRDVKVYQPVRAEKGQNVTLTVIYDYNNTFQVTHKDDLVCEGSIQAFDPSSKTAYLPEPSTDCRNEPGPTEEMLGVDPKKLNSIDAADFYQDTERQGLRYGPKFRMVKSRAIDKSFAELIWDKDWIIHLDGIFQTTYRRTDHNCHVARGLRRLVILDTYADKPSGYVERQECDTYAKITRAPSFLMEDYVDGLATQKPKPSKLVITRNTFLPYGERPPLNPSRADYARQLAAVVKQVIGAGIKDTNAAHLLKVKAAAEKLSGGPLTAAELETIKSADDKKLAAIYASALASSSSSLQEAILKSADLPAALETDAVLSGFGQRELDILLGAAVGNQDGAGYKICEAGAGAASFTKKALETCIKIPASTLLSYIATNTTNDSSAVSQAVSHNRLSYQTWDFNQPSATAPCGIVNVIAASHLSAKTKNLSAVLKNMADSLAEGGFLLLEELTGPLGACLWGLEPSAWEHEDGREFGPCTSVAHWARLLSDVGLTEISTLRCPEDSSACFLYRKLRTVVPRVIPLEGPSLHANDLEREQWLEEYLAAVKEANAADATSQGNVWLHGSAASSPGLLGFVASARKEQHGDRLRCAMEISWDESAASKVASKIQAIAHLDLVSNIFKDGRHGFYQPVQIDHKAVKEENEATSGCHLEVTQYGNLKSISWVENAPFILNGSETVVCDVAFGALNFRDVMLAYGKLSRDQMAHENGGDNIGFEFSGSVVDTGRRVMGSATNAIATRVVTRPKLIWCVPEQWSLAEAATVPTAYMTAYYSLVMRGHLREGMRVLIHSGTGAVGLAAIQIALSRGAEVYATVGTPAKRKFLLNAFPQLDEAHIADSRSLEFEKIVLSGTKGRGVHLALNALADDKLQATVRCIGHDGRLLEIGKYDILKGTPLSMKPMLNNIAFEGIDVDRVMNSADSRQLDELWQMVQTGIDSGEVKPLPVTAFKRTEVEEAFRYMGKGVHIGKCLIDVSATPSKQSTANALGASTQPGVPQNGHELVPRLPALQPSATLAIRPDRSYIVTGGVGGFGLAVAELLALNGAKHLVITSKRGIRSGAQVSALTMYYQLGARFKVSTLDVAVPEECEQVVELAESMAPIGGVFHLAMVLKDRLLQNQTGENWNACVKPKAIGAYNLDKATRGIKTLEHFVMWSSIAASAGNEGQTSYGFANSSQDVLAEERKNRGLPALSIQWGVIDHVGVADKRIQQLMEEGLLGASMPQPIDDCVAVLARLMAGASGNSVGAVMGSCWQKPDLLNKASSSSDNKDILGPILSVMGLKETDVNDTDTLSHLGVDSMMMIEVRANLQRGLGRPVSLDEVSSISIGKIKELQGDSGTSPAANASIPDAAEETPQEEGSKTSSRAIFVPRSVKPSPEALANAKKAESLSQPKLYDITSQKVSIMSPTTPHKGKGHRSDSVTSMTRSNGSSRDVSPRKVTLASPTSSLENLPALNTEVNEAETVTAAFSWTNFAYYTAHAMAIGLWLFTDYAFRAAASVANNYGLFWALPLLPLLWLCIGLTLSTVTVLVKAYIMPTIVPGQVVNLWSADYARWWLVCRLVDTANAMFMRYFRGTAILTEFYRLLGAKIGKGAFIDTLDVMDFDFLEIGADACVGEGTTLLAHTIKDGELVFSEVIIGERAEVLPFSVVTPDTKVPAKRTLMPLSKETSLPPRAPPSSPLFAALKQNVASKSLTSAITTLGQVGGMALTVLLVCVATFAGCATYEFVAHALGLASIHLSPAAYAVIALALAVHPFLLAYVPILVPPSHDVSIFEAFAAAPAVIASLSAIPLAFAVFATVLTVLSGAAKHVLVGRVQPGVHERNSVYGVRFWAAQRMVDAAYWHVGKMLIGTWGLSALYKVFGAKLGSDVNLRKCNVMSVPDMLQMGTRTHLGDAGRIVASIAKDSTHIVTAPVVIQDYSLLGAGIVLLPGTTIGESCTVGPLTVPAMGRAVSPKTLILGSPARPIREEVRGPLEEYTPLTQALCLGAPFAQVAGCVVMQMVAVLPPALLAWLTCAGNQGPIGMTVAALGAGLHSAQLVSLANRYLQSHCAPIYSEHVRRYSAKFWLACILGVIGQIPVDHCDFIFRGAPSYFTTLRKMGFKIAEGAYLDAEILGEPGLMTFGKNCVVERGSLLFGHLGAFTDNGAFHMYFKPVEVAEGATVGPRAAMMPGTALTPGASLAAGQLILQ